MLLGKLGLMSAKMARKCPLKLWIARLVELRWCTLGGGELILRLLSAFNELIVGSASFVVHDLEINVVVAAC